MDSDNYVHVGGALTKKRNGRQVEYRITHYRNEPYSQEELVPKLGDLLCFLSGTVQGGTWTGLPLGGPNWSPQLPIDFQVRCFDTVTWSDDFRKAVNLRKKNGDDTVNKLWNVIHLGATITPGMQTPGP